MLSHIRNLLIPGLAIIFLGAWIWSTSLQPRETVNPANSVTDYYVFNNGSSADVFQGSQFFGNEDKLGVDQLIVDQFPSRSADFLAIGNDNMAREQFLTNQGHTFESPANTWKIMIGDSGTVGGQARLAVGAILGKNIEQNGGITEHHEAILSEIWQLNANGPPTLLERTTDFQEGVFTTAEHPPVDADLTWPAGITGGSAPDFMGN